MHRLPSAEAFSGKAVPAVASLAVIALLTALSGCGQKGPLYMPRAGTTNPAPLPTEPVAPTTPETAPETATPPADPTDTENAAGEQGDQHAA